MSNARRITVLLCLAAAVTACNKADRKNAEAKADSAAGAVTDAAKTAFSVIDIDMGRHIDPASKISDKTDDFMPKDTIFASLHTSGTAQAPMVMAKWTFQDTVAVNEQAVNVTTTDDAYTAFFIANPKGFAKGKYTVHIMIDGKEVRTKDVTVK